MLRVPVLAHLFRIVEDCRFPSVILPIVGVDTDVSLVVVLSVGAPDCFEMKDVEVHIWLKLFYQFDRQFSLRVSERAKLSIFALL